MNIGDAGAGQQRIEIDGELETIHFTRARIMENAKPPVTLMKALDDWTEEEIAALFDEHASGWRNVSSSYEDVKDVREWLISPNGQSEPQSSIDRLVTVLNWSEEIRLMMGIMLRVSERNRKAYGTAGCAFCEWKYKDATFEMPADRVAEPEEIAEVNARLQTAIVEHVKVCPNHPTRKLETAVDRALDIIETGVLEPRKSDVIDEDKLPILSLDEWKELYRVLHRARNVE